MRQDWGPLALVTQVGLTVAAALILSLLLGIWLDRQFGTHYLFTLIFALLGIGAAMVSVYRMVSQAIDESVRERGPTRRPGSHPPQPGSDRPNSSDDEDDESDSEDDDAWPDR